MIITSISIMNMFIISSSIIIIMNFVMIVIIISSSSSIGFMCYIVCLVCLF